jgi:hypothetical protein
MQSTEYFRNTTEIIYKRSLTKSCQKIQIIRYNYRRNYLVYERSKSFFHVRHDIS